MEPETMLFLARCTLYIGRPTPVAADAQTGAPTPIHGGQVLSAWRAVECDIGVTLVDAPALAAVPSLLERAFPEARYFEVLEALPVAPVTAAELSDAGRRAQQTSEARLQSMSS